MKTQYIIKHKLTNKEHILNAKEKEQFYQYQNKFDYLESELLEIETETNWKEEIGLALIGIAIVILGTKIIVEWL
tara:strand:- start:299 stop:523 length:225 start_codon:yes stop_codon:yes gene_type:complete